MIASKVTVTTSATLLSAASQHPSQVLLAVPTGGAPVFIGGADVTTAAGYPVAAGEKVALDMHGESIYGIVSASTQDVNVLRRSN